MLKMKWKGMQFTQAQVKYYVLDHQNSAKRPSNISQLLSKLTPLALRILIQWWNRAQEFILLKPFEAGGAPECAWGGLQQKAFIFYQYFLLLPTISSIGCCLNIPQSVLLSQLPLLSLTLFNQSGSGSAVKNPPASVGLIPVL